MRKLRDISEHAGNPDMQFLQQKIALAGNMKTAIKRLLDTTVVPPEYPHYYLVPINRWNELKKAMEAYLNCESGSVNTDKS